MKIREILDINVTTSHLKKAGATLLAGIIITGGGLCLAHEYKDEHKHQECAAYIQSQAAEKNITLIDEAKAKSVAAQTIGVAEKDITFHKCSLKNYQGKISNDFKPVYKVKCFSNGVKYSLRIDAVTGEVIKDYDKDHFKHGGDKAPQAPEQQNQ